MKRTLLSRICLLGIVVGSHCAWAYARDGQVQKQELTPSIASLHESWNDDYAYLQGLIAKRGGCAGLYTPDTEALTVAHPHSRIWASDRTPLDVQLRRTDAVLEQIGSMVAPTSQAEKALRELEQQFQRLARTAAVLSPAHGKDASGAEKDLYIELRELNRKIVLSNPLLDFDDIIFNRWNSSYGHVQECWGSTVLNEGGLYALRGALRGA
ncbi:MAG: hypothetical protein H8E73_04535 [Planctomycetes bacterium]|nr:hypothetical protein [Planctomycetota bacterium]